MGKTRTRGFTAFAVALLTAGSALALAPAADALTYVDSGVAIRSAPYTSGTTIYGRGYPGQNVVEHSYASGSTYSYNNKFGSGSSSLWSDTTNTTTNVSGWSGFWFIG